jgi:hypothetical protein
MIVLMLVLATGGHWAMLQSVAWLGMAVRFSQNEPLVPALQKTFSGAHPCTLCKAVSHGVKTEKEQKIQKIESKFDFFCSRTAVVLEVPLPEARTPQVETKLSDRNDSPPVPPPRLA